jgi:hypothetical protein
LSFHRILVLLPFFFDFFLDPALFGLFIDHVRGCDYTYGRQDCCAAHREAFCIE